MRNIRPKQLNGANRRIAALRDRVHGRLNWAGNRTYRMSPAKAQFALSGYRAPPWSPKMQHLSISRVLAIVSPTSPTAGIARGERIGIAEGRVQRSALQGVRVQAALASVAAVIFGGGCSGSSSFKRCNRSR